QHLVAGKVVSSEEPTRHHRDVVRLGERLAKIRQKVGSCLDTGPVVLVEDEDPGAHQAEASDVRSRKSDTLSPMGAAFRIGVVPVSVASSGGIYQYSEVLLSVLAELRTSRTEEFVVLGNGLSRSSPILGGVPWEL